MIREEGEAATLEVGVHGIHPELVRLARQNEVPDELWTECIEAFHRSSPAYPDCWLLKSVWMSELQNVQVYCMISVNQ